MTAQARRQTQSSNCALPTRPIITITMPRHVRDTSKQWLDYPHAARTYRGGPRLLHPHSLHVPLLTEQQRIRPHPHP